MNEHKDKTPQELRDMAKRARFDASFDPDYSGSYLHLAAMWERMAEEKEKQ